MRVLALSSYPDEAAATRFRVTQFIDPLRDRGVELIVSPFLDSKGFAQMYSRGRLLNKAVSMVKPVASRLMDIVQRGGCDLLFVQREAMMFGPPVFEWLYSRMSNVPLVLDLDDATYVRYVSPTYGRFASVLKFQGKTDALIKRSAMVICGNRFIAEYVRSKERDATVIPTVVDLELFRPSVADNPGPTRIGWIGTPSTFPFLASLFPVLERLAKTHRFVLKIVGSGLSQIAIPGVETELVDWALDREIDDFRSLDLGLYPITTSVSANEQWIMGKSGFKAIQYMAVGVPFVMTPVGVGAELGKHGSTHFNASSENDWYNSLNALLDSPELRARMGEAARSYAEANFDLGTQADLLAAGFRSVLSTRGKQ